MRQYMQGRNSSGEPPQMAPLMMFEPQRKGYDRSKFEVRVKKTLTKPILSQKLQNQSRSLQRDFEGSKLTDRAGSMEDEQLAVPAHGRQFSTSSKQKPEMQTLPTASKPFKLSQPKAELMQQHLLTMPDPSAATSTMNDSTARVFAPLKIEHSAVMKRPTTQQGKASKRTGVLPNDVYNIYAVSKPANQWLENMSAFSSFHGMRA